MQHLLHRHCHRRQDQSHLLLVPLVGVEVYPCQACLEEECLQVLEGACLEVPCQFALEGTCWACLEVLLEVLVPERLWLGFAPGCLQFLVAVLSELEPN